MERDSWHEIINRLKSNKSHHILKVLRAGVADSDRKVGKMHQVFEPSFDWKECYSNELMEQKLNYMHDNPCVGKWNLSNSPSAYPHSSAKYYLKDIQGIYKVTSYLDLEDIDLTKPN